MEHLLLAPCGKNVGDVLSTLFWLNRRDRWEPGDRRPPDSLPPVTHLWVLTSDDSDTIRRLPTKLIKPLRTSFGELSERRVLLAAGVGDIFSTADAKKVAELLYRLVLHGEGWRSEPDSRRYFSIHVPGDRNAFAGNLLRAATFFEVDNLLQLVFDAVGTEEPPDDLPTIERKTEEYYPIFMEEECSPWRRLLDKPWLDEYPRRPLAAHSFALRDWHTTGSDWIKTFPDEEPNSLALITGLKTIASHTKRFVDQALACGVGPYFLKHDLRGLVDRLQIKLPDNRELTAMSEYLVGLSQVLEDQPPNWSAVSLSVSRLPAICDQALTLALGQAVDRHSDDPPGWQLCLDRGELVIEWERWKDYQDRRLRGISEPALLPVLRNIFANVWKHGMDEGKASAVLAFDSDASVPGSLLLTCRNRLPEGRLNDLVFRNRVESNGLMQSLLQPFVKAPSQQQKSDGLGLFTVHRTAERTSGAVTVVGPWLEPWDEQWCESETWAGGSVDFLIGLRFRDVVT